MAGTAMTKLTRLASPNILYLLSLVVLDVLAALHGESHAAQEQLT